MRLLLDTHILIWSLMDPGRLPKGLRKQLADPNVEVLVSAVNAWEMAIKASIGKLVLPKPVAALCAEIMRDFAFTHLPISWRHAAAVQSMPMHHRDPFDRLLVAQAKCDDLVLVSDDVKLDVYDVTRVFG